MIVLRNPVTGHEIKTDPESADFWSRSGYRGAEPEKPKATAKKSASKKSSK